MRRVLSVLAFLLGVALLSLLASSCSPPERPLAHSPPISSSTSTTSTSSSTTTSTSTTSTTIPTPPTSPPAPRTTSSALCPAAETIAQTWPPEAVARAIEIAYRESRCLGYPVSSTGCRGLFQLYRGWDALYIELGLDPANWADPWTNSTVAAEIYRRSGWNPWHL